MSAHILVVDDNDINLKVASKVLEKEGYKVSTALNGKDALVQANKTPPDLAILDVMMPDMDGYELCEKIRNTPKIAHIPVIMLTALSRVDDRLKAFEAGADDFLTKPFNVAELRARVKVLLRYLDTHDENETDYHAYKIAVFSLRGGIGVSTLASNLAVGLTQLWDEESLLIDLALVNGQSALMLDLSLRNTLGDLAEIPVDEIDVGLLEQITLQHPGGTRVLAAPRKAIEADLVTEEKVKKIISLLEAHYPYFVFDLPHDFNATTIAALDSADKILLMLAPEMASIRSAGMALSVFNDLAYPKEKIDLVLNWNFQSQGLPRDEIEAALNKKISIVIPYASGTIVSAITKGKPPVLDEEETPLKALLEDLAYYWSEADQKKIKPDSPTESWMRVAKRIRKRVKKNA